MTSKSVSRALLVCLVALAATLYSFSQSEPDQRTAPPANARSMFTRVLPRAHANAGTTNAASLAPSGISGIDSLVNFTGSYHTFGYDPNDNPHNTWYYDMVGNQPQKGGTTVIRAPILPVIVQLLDTNGSIRVVKGTKLISSPTAFVMPTVNSPVFRVHPYTSGPEPTQFTDAVQRAEFYHVMRPDWHTLLAVAIKRTRRISVPSGFYQFQLNPDHSCCAYILIEANEFVNLLFPTVPTDTTTPVGAAENAGDITTRDMSTLLFANTFLYVNTVDNCCILGFHSYDYEPGDASNGNRERRYVMNYSSWISPGLFSGGVQDITALSHEIAETYNDPFVASDNVHGITPWWLAPNGNCQDDMEIGDVIEGLSNGVYPIWMNKMSYHPQNEALLQWFEFQSPSTALNGAYSYPNKGTLKALSPVEHANCM